MELVDSIFIEDLSVSSRVGISEEERAAPQDLSVSITVQVPLAKAANSGELNDSICYHRVYQLAKDVSETREWVLLEEIAEQIIAKIFAEFPKSLLARVKVRKFILPDCKSTGVELTRKNVS